jgi:hypothetical protein
MRSTVPVFPWRPMKSCHASNTQAEPPDVPATAHSFWSIQRGRSPTRVEYGFRDDMIFFQFYLFFLLVPHHTTIRSIHHVVHPHPSTPSSPTRANSRAWATQPSNPNTPTPCVPRPESRAESIPPQIKGGTTGPVRSKYSNPVGQDRQGPESTPGVVCKDKGQQARSLVCQRSLSIGPSIGLGFEVESALFRSKGWLLDWAFRILQSSNRPSGRDTRHRWFRPSSVVL